MPKRVSEALSNAIVRDPDGHARPLHQLWATRAALVLWVRHFG
jgi:hypothetical protein